jgi:hypothetical protein
VNAQKIVDERHGPARPHQFFRVDRRAREFDHFFIAGSAYKGKDEGCASSYKAARYYSNEAEKWRNEIMAEVAAEEEALAAAVSS